METIRQAIRHIARGDDTTAIVCRVDSVDASARTCDCTPIDGSAPLLDVGLQAVHGGTSGLLITPRVGSEVLVCLASHATAAFVLVTAEVQSVSLDAATSITINGGANGGLINIDALTSVLNNLVSAFNAHTHPAPGGATSAPTVLIKSIDKSTYEDTKVTH